MRVVSGFTWKGYDKLMARVKHNVKHSIAGCFKATTTNITACIAAGAALAPLLNEESA